MNIDIMKIKTNGVKKNDQRIHCIRFADDIVTIAGPEHDMINMLKVLTSAFDKFKI